NLLSVDLQLLVVKEWLCQCSLSPDLCPGRERVLDLVQSGTQTGEMSKQHRSETIVIEPFHTGRCVNLRGESRRKEAVTVQAPSNAAGRAGNCAESARPGS